MSMTLIAAAIFIAVLAISVDSLLSYFVKDNKIRIWVWGGATGLVATAMAIL
jgi:hypothetical protein